ncbi:hypothetical protein DPMN_190631 [Dreissena polymorpha]|uniref:Reverse transcriptase domain-containing protein n=1 Tax=Dreissena polymorpha TaxID=45954 RepID=A0A9D3Y0S8_DREPO|nr:hypothetical protein DPMN_190631 [Dreissena polymorpha]
MKFDNVIDWKLHKQLIPTIDSPPKLYGLPKMIGKTEHCVKNSKHFPTLIKNKQVEEDEFVISYDVSALFTNVPVDRAFDIIHNKLLWIWS